MKSKKKENKFKALNRHIARLENRIDHLEKLSSRYGWIRLAAVLIGALGTFLVYHFSAEWFSWAVLVLFIIIFLTLGYFHRQLDEGIGRHRIWLEIRKAHRARMSLDWGNILAPVTGSTGREHPFESDLNLTGQRSLHQLIDTAVSEGGSRRLRSWLLATVPNLSDLEHRRGIVRELAPKSLFRDKLRLNALDAAKNSREGLQIERLLAWLQKQEIKSLKFSLILLAVLSAANIVLFILHQFSIVPAIWVFTFIIYLGFYFFKIRDFKDLFEEAYHLQNSLHTFRAVLTYLEKSPFPQNSRLSEFCSPFREGNTRPSVYLKRISWLTGAAGISQRSQVLWLVFNALVPWDFYFSHRLNHYKGILKIHLGEWIDRWYELEALCSLANFADLNPNYIFPEVSLYPAAGNSPLFETHELGHPLLPDERKVCNDFLFQNPGDIAIITGSNMSGKSTFLRTLGVNLCLAYAGGPVDAVSFRTVTFRLFTCINVSDSLNDSVSYFYAEVRRLKEILNELKKEHPFPLFFLIDEIFKGTNNRERLIGSRSYIKVLTGEKGVGAIATHDLELVKLSEGNPNIRNFHFKEEVRDGTMVFDYKLQPGPSPTTNALKIMQLEGLPVE